MTDFDAMEIFKAIDSRIYKFKLREGRRGHLTSSDQRSLDSLLKAREAFRGRPLDAEFCFTYTGEREKGKIV